MLQDYHRWSYDLSLTSYGTVTILCHRSLRCPATSHVISPLVARTNNQAFAGLVVGPTPINTSEDPRHSYAVRSVILQDLATFTKILQVL